MNNFPQIIFASAVAVALTAPQNPEYLAETLSDERQDNGDGNFRYSFQTSNDISASQVGTPGILGQSNVQGSFRFPLTTGGFAEVSYIADENGYQPTSDLLPTPPPLPAHVFELLRIADEQRAQGITFN
ncbi:Cuticle protein AMP4 [Penaeus vannamei]|uniref:Cuticle protein AMP4 n=1 Tax=Penaeus vannamei TaxID=6689 RepID=A0A3R7PX84_PENVA|nr:Cuticle protein AMP4 [Penaeus vannamei]